MKLLRIRLSALLMCLGLITSALANEQQHYAEGSLISNQITLFDKQQTPQNLSQLLAKIDKPVNLLYLFGGGGMGHASTDKTGGIWCPDSYADLDILHSLAERYGERIGILPIAIPPVFDTRSFGVKKGGMIEREIDDSAYQQAVNAFVNSTQAAFELGTIPLQPLLDLHFNLLISEQTQAMRNNKSNAKQDWHGAFRAPEETQSYGVPNIWLVNSHGKVLSEPFRGNIYHAHGSDIAIRYTLQDVIAAIERNLED